MRTMSFGEAERTTSENEKLENKKIDTTKKRFNIALLTNLPLRNFLPQFLNFQFSTLFYPFVPGFLPPAHHRALGVPLS